MVIKDTDGNTVCTVVDYSYSDKIKARYLSNGQPVLDINNTDNNPLELISDFIQRNPNGGLVLMRSNPIFIS